MGAMESPAVDFGAPILPKMGQWFGDKASITSVQVRILAGPILRLLIKRRGNNGKKPNSTKKMEEDHERRIYRI